MKTRRKQLWPAQRPAERARRQYEETLRYLDQADTIDICPPEYLIDAERVANNVIAAALSAARRRVPR
jgi:hypothetical protein